MKPSVQPPLPGGFVALPRWPVPGAPPSGWRQRFAVRVLALLGWRIAFDGLPAAQGVIVVYPHTSNWDFPFAVLAKWAMGLQLHFWGKDSLFRIPVLSRFMRHIGGIPVDRQSPHGIVGAMAAEFAKAQSEGRDMWLALAPEGTRAYRDAWRSGFYHLCLKADLPLGLAYIDTARREIGLTRFVSLSGDPGRDEQDLAAYYEGCRGFRPDLAAPVRWHNAASEPVAGAASKH